MNKVLVIVDMQNDFVYGTLGSPEAQNIVGNIKWKLDCARQNGDLVIFTRDTHYENYLDTKEGKNLPVKHCIKNTKGWEIVPELTPNGNEIVIDKSTFGSLDLQLFIKNMDTLKEIDEVTIVGVDTSICVVSNALMIKAVLSKAEINVVSDCCASLNSETHYQALEVMKMCQINVV